MTVLISLPMVLALGAPPLGGASPAGHPETGGAERRFPPADTVSVWIPPGTTLIGCAAGDSECHEDEKPPRRVTISRGFWIDTTEVPLASFRAFSRAAGQPLPPPPSFAQNDAHPVVNVTWAEAAAYCSWAGGRLPTEAEWEYAARSGSEGATYPSGHALARDHANWEGVEGRDRWGKTAPVGSLAPNPWGLFDAAGNVWEWTADWYDPRVGSGGAVSDPAGPTSGTLKVVRGGAYNAQPRSLRSSNRGKFNPSARMESIGLRCVHDGETPAGPPVEEHDTGATAAVSPPVVPAAAPTPISGTVVRREERAPVTTGPGAQRRNFPPSSIEMALVPPGAYEIGAVRGDGAGFADEQPRHAITLTRGVWMGVTEVTVAQYRSYGQATGTALPSTPSWADDSHPVVGVTWEQASAYCRWAGGRLPTEAEWEAAARGGSSGLRYPWGTEISHDDANFDGVGGRDAWPKSAPVGSFAANGFGLVDVSGNVWEWTADWYDERYYARSPAIDPEGPEDGKARVVRGGCWTSDPGRLRSSYRFSLDPSDSQVSVGFRCARDPE
ncbi:MAG: formylglycine-generating enzyme family protein [Acidobacteriota bacterium]